MRYLSIKYSLLMVFTLVIGNSCNEKNLDLKPQTPTEEEYFLTETEFDRAVYGVYSKLHYFYRYPGSAAGVLWPVTYLPGDDITTTDQNEFEVFAQIQPGSTRLNDYYRQTYQLIGRANVVLQKNAAPEAASVYTNQSLKNYHRGEALFLRAYMHYNLWNVFGTAPLLTERLTDQTKVTPPSTSGTQLLDQAITDLTEAATLLPPAWPDAERGRATANSAYGLLGKCLVFRGTVTKSTADFTAAITAFNSITGASLVPKFDDNFAFDTENNAESLFEYQASQNVDDNYWVDGAGGPDAFDVIGTMSAFWGFYDNNYALFGTPTFTATQKLANLFEAGDPRKELTLNPENLAFRKYVARGKTVPNGVGSVNNARILRYADVLLLKAEAIVQSGGTASEAIQLINQVRARARNMVPGGTAPADRDLSVSDRNTILQWIVDERLMELAGEGQRWFDLRRWQLAGNILPGGLTNSFFSSAIPEKISFQEKNLNFPIPNSETDVNKNITQNPGY